MNNPLGFFSDLLRQPAWIPAWVGFLAIINLASVLFWSEPLARLVLATFMISAFLMMALYARFGFDKILGLGHILWIGLLPYLLIRLPDAPAGFRSYLIVLALAIAVSLVFDVVDVWKYLAGRQKRHGPR